jgi:hypothetical protein
VTEGDRGSAGDGARYAAAFLAGPGESEFRAVDPIERRQLTFHASTPVDPTPVAASTLQFPVDESVSVETGSVSVDTVVTTIVRDADGTSIAQFEHLEEVTVADGPVIVELCTPIKIYLRVEGGATVRTGLDRTEVELATPGRVVVGGRSHHEHPSAELGIPATPRGVMAGISTFGTALKTLSPERSFPTLRGHPPTFAVGESMSIPTELGPPETGVTIEVPEAFAPAYTVAPLAYYLAATVEPGTSPTLHLDGAGSYPLDADGLETTVDRTLKQSLLLDCVVRTEGLYEIPLAERLALESGDAGGTYTGRIVDPGDYPDAIEDLPPLAELYHWPLPQRLDAYLQLDYEAVADVVPDWHLAAVVQPTAEYADALPYLAHRLASVRTRAPSTGSTGAGRRTGRTGTDLPDPVEAPDADGGRVDSSGDRRGRRRARGVSHTESGGALLRGDVRRVVRDMDSAQADGGGPLTRSQSQSSTSEVDGPGPDLRRSGRRDNLFTPSQAVALRTDGATTTTWIGDGFPINAGMTPVTAFENRLAREPTESDLSFVVVCNESEMGAEQRIVESVYGNRSDLTFDVDIRTGLSRADLTDVFEAGHDFVHYIGHVDVRGFRCADGHLDVGNVDGVDCDAFFLNACHSVDQGVGLIEQGSIGGIVTLDSVLNRDAVAFGQTIARLLNSGYRIGAAVHVAQYTLEREHLYNVVGDPTLAITQSDGVPNICEIEEIGDDRFRLQYNTFPAARSGLGSFFRPFLEQVDVYALNGSRLIDLELSGAQLQEFLSYEAVPVLSGGEMIWSDDFENSVTGGRSV